jgi:hypothetical protein
MRRLKSLRVRAAEESRWRRLGWLGVLAVLVFVPLGFNLAREPGFKASVALFPQKVGPYPAIDDPAYYMALLNDPVLQEQMRLNVGTGVARYEDVTIKQGPRPFPMSVTVEANSPKKAQTFVNALAVQLNGATQRELVAAATKDAEGVRARLLDASNRKERARLRPRVRRLERIRERQPTRVLPGAPAGPPRMGQWADRVVDDLPGAFPPRPSPVWAALAGLFVGATLWCIGLVLVPPGGRRLSG